MHSSATSSKLKAFLSAIRRAPTFLVLFIPGLLAGCTASRGVFSADPAGSVVANQGQDQRPQNPSLVLPLAHVDELVAASWKQAGVAPAALADDGEFLRRVTLDLVGRVPTLAEAEAFLVDRTPDKRARAVDRLLASPDFAEHWADLYENLLWRTDDSKRIERDDPRAYLVAAFQQNLPYDKLAFAVLTASGTVEENGATAFVAARARGGGGPEAVAAAAARVFLGLQIQCAQCHDHPYDSRWKQEDFYGLVGYFARVAVRRDRAGKGREREPLMLEAMSMDEASPQRGKNKPGFMVRDRPRGEARMTRPGSTTPERVAPRFLGTEVAGLPGENRRVTFARAAIASDLFAKSMVARTWAQLFGQGLVDPWDDLGAPGEPSHPPLLSALADGFRVSGFDVRALLRTLVLSAAYQRSSLSTASGGDDGGKAFRAFAQARVRALSSEQLFRATMTATGADDMFRQRGGEERLQKRVARGLREYRFTFDDDEMSAADGFDGSLAQALLLWNGELTNQGARAARGGVLDAVLRSGGDDTERVRRLFLGAYTRWPTDSELRAALAFVEGERGGERQRFEDLFFALLTSTEAITNH